MTRSALVDEERALWRLQSMLPVSAHGRPKLLKFREAVSRLRDFSRLDCDEHTLCPWRHGHHVPIPC